MSGKVAPSAKDGAKSAKPAKSEKSAKSGKSAKTTDETGSAKGGARATGKAARKTGGSGTA